MKLPFKLVAIDLETTDSDPKKGDIIQIGAVIVNEDLSLGETFNSYLKPYSDYRNPQAMAVNGISEETLDNAPFGDGVLQGFEEFAEQAGRRPILAAWGAYFDVPFLEAYYEKIGRTYPFSFKSFDLKSVAIWEASKGDVAQETTYRRDGGLGAYVEGLGLEFEGKAHDALDDILMAVKVIQKLASQNNDIYNKAYADCLNSMIDFVRENAEEREIK